MTASQVITAFKGTATTMPETSQCRNEEDKYEITVEAKLNEPPVLKVVFMFDLPGGGLR